MGSRLIFLRLFEGRLSDGVTQKGSPAGGWKSRCKPVGGGCRQIRVPVNAEG